MIISFDECYRTIDLDRKVASITNPSDYTIVYIAKKIEKEIRHLYDVKDCIVILQEGIKVPRDLEERHIFVIASNPQEAFDKIVRRVYCSLEGESDCKAYITKEDGVIVGKDVIIGENTIIEPGVFLDHGVIIGDRCRIKSGAVRMLLLDVSRLIFIEVKI